MWEQLLANIRRTISRAISHVQIATVPRPQSPVAVGATTNGGPQAQTLRENRSEQAAVPAAKVNGRKLGRNDVCWCGSGKKFKRCHGANA
jgi:preprotein translocase subunit SecA